jgi:hypothetical protein
MKIIVAVQLRNYNLWSNERILFIVTERFNSAFIYPNLNFMLFHSIKYMGLLAIKP